MTLQEAKNLLTQENLEHLREVICPFEVNINKKDCDVVMSALCTAIQSNIIKIPSLDENAVALLNSDTSTLTAMKLLSILKTVNQHQDICCVITCEYHGIRKTFVFTHNNDTLSYNGIYHWVLETCDVTSKGIRQHMEGRYKPSVINNIAQILPKVEKNPNEIVSIKNISRILTAFGGTIKCSFITSL